MSNVKIREAIHNLKVNPNASTTASRIRDFTRMHESPTFFNSKVEKDPKGFIDSR